MKTKKKGKQNLRMAGILSFTLNNVKISTMHPSLLRSEKYIHTLIGKKTAEKSELGRYM